MIVGVLIGFNIIQAPERLKKIFGYFTLLLSVAFLAKGFYPFTKIFSFNTSWDTHHFSISSSIGVLFALSYVVVLIYGMFLLTRKISLLVAFVALLTAIACAAAVGFSPTRYASGARPMFIPSTLFIVCAFILFSRLNYKLYRNVILLLR